MHHLLPIIQYELQSYKMLNKHAKNNWEGPKLFPFSPSYLQLEYLLS